MEIVLGVSMRPTSVSMIVVEGENADGAPEGRAGDAVLAYVQLAVGMVDEHALMIPVRRFGPDPAPGHVLREVAFQGDLAALEGQQPDVSGFPLVLGRTLQERVDRSVGGR